MVKVVKEGTILPVRYVSQIFDWGIGGVIDENGNFVEESGMEVPHRFGGKYAYDEKECTYLGETVIYVGPVRDHWGHFLAECSVRFWYLLENQENYKVAFCGLWFEEGKLSPKLLDVFRLLGIEKDRLLDIRKPTKFKQILIPSPTLEYKPFRFIPGEIEDFFNNWGEWNRSWSYTADFKNIFKSMADKVNLAQYETADKIYYTRTGMEGKKEIGEKLIEKIFRENGYRIVSPEKESVEMQIALMNSCKAFASMEGTLAHNIIFAKEKIKQVILLKRKGENALQEPLNKCMDIKAEHIYIECRPFGFAFPHGGWNGIRWIRACRALKEWCKENHMWFPGPGEIFVNDIKNLWSYLQLCSQELRTLMKTKWEMMKEDKQILKMVKEYQNIILYGVNARCLHWKDKIRKRYPQKQLYWADTNYEAMQKYIRVYSVDDVIENIGECVYLIGINNKTAVEEVRKEILRKGVSEKMIYPF